MKIAISNIAWEPDEEHLVAEIMQASRITGVELAPSKLWSDPAEADATATAEVRDLWHKRGIDIVALQALLFGHPELVLFGDEDARQRMVDYLGGIFRVAGELGAGPLVFGSPKNRKVGDMPRAKAEELAVETFRKLGDMAQTHGVLLCIEPNATDYGCDFVTNSAEGLDLVKRIDHPGVRLHLDAGVMTMNGEDCERAIGESIEYLAHFHVSEPWLATVGTSTTGHNSMAAALRKAGYDGWVSIEMRAGDGPNTHSVRRAIEHTIAAYR